MDGWKMIHLLFGFSLFFRGPFAVSFKGVYPLNEFEPLCATKKKLFPLSIGPRTTKENKKNLDTFHEILVV